jgi:glycosyltransferase involved in cell wall biosynthesis
MRCSDGPAPRIADPYLVVINIPSAVSANSVQLTELWAKDLEQHLAVIDNLLLACPVQHRVATPEERPVSAPGRDPAFVLVPLPDASSTLAALLVLPRTVERLWTAVGRARIVHCAVAGWPIPLGWLAAALATIRHRFLIVTVESTYWRDARDGRMGLKFHIRRAAFEWMARWCVRRADLAFYAHRGYERDFPARNSECGHVVPASWVDAENVRSLSEVRADWEAKISVQGPFRVLFVGKLIRQKGVRELLRATDLLRQRGVPVTLDIFGDGELRAECVQACDASRGTIRYRGTLPYGQSFFNALREGDVLVVPSLSDEQPRVVYDAYSQGIPVIASRTPGLADCVQDGITGTLVPSGNVVALADAVQRFVVNREALVPLAVRASEVAKSLTHASTHALRARIIERCLQSRMSSR